MIYEITIRVKWRGLTATETYKQEFADNSNVFGRVLEFRQRIKKFYPNAIDYEIIKAKRL